MDLLRVIHLRSSDTIFSIGGEEFLVLLHNSNISEASLAAKELCKEIELLALLPEQVITVSIGVSGLQPDDDLSTWMKRTDKKLYLAKPNGRNRVAV
jgi:diguanylate cyclase